jgi:hypothetical protein
MPRKLSKLVKQRLRIEHIPITKTFWNTYNMPPPVPEFKFHKTRKWRIDYCWSTNKVKLAVEIEGGVWSQGAHIRPKSFIEDMEKYNALTEAGYYLLRYLPGKSNIDYDQIARVYNNLLHTKQNEG